MRWPRAEGAPGPIGAAIALCFLAKKSVYEAVGGFDENLFILYEDNEFSYKLRMRGHTIRPHTQQHTSVLNPVFSIEELGSDCSHTRPYGLGDQLT